MWLFVFFDMPTNTKKDRKKAAGFRKRLLEDGFQMLQYSVYIRHCGSSESADVHENRVRQMITGKGRVSILRITDKQYGKIISYWGEEYSPPPQTVNQLEIF